MPYSSRGPASTSGRNQGMTRDHVLLLDVGNTSAKAVAAGPQGPRGEPVPVSGHQSFDAAAWAAWLRGVQGRHGAGALVFASVVPDCDGPIREAARALGLTASAVPGDIPVPLKNRYARPHEVGADRLVGSYAARCLFPDAERIVVVDFGTATTFDCVEGDAFLGGLICPGLLSSARSLHTETAKLPLPDLELDDESLHIGRSTMDSLNQGILFGAAAMVEGLCLRLAGFMGGPARVVATGGLAPAVARLCPAIDALVPDLMFQGLWRVHAAFSRPD